MIPDSEEPVVRIAGDERPGGVVEAGDRFDGTVVSVGSTGVPGVEPLVAVTRGGTTAFYADRSPEAVGDLLDGLADGFDAVASDADAVADHDPETTRLPVPDLPGFGVGVRRVLGGCGWRRPTDPGDHEAAGGFGDPGAEAVLAAGSDLLGRGWADWCQDDPVAPTWDRAREAGDDAAVVVNAHGNDADALLLSSSPFEVLEGASAVASAVGADRVVVYASTDEDRAVETAREAAGEYPDPPAPFDVVTGPDDYRAAEPTMAIEAIEGNHRLEARLRPPGPEEVGLHGRPTVVHTPRTLAHLAVALRDEEALSTRVTTVTGDVADPATVELPASEPLATAMGAVEVEGEFKTACVGGRFGGMTDDLEVAADPGVLAEADLGTEGTVHVLAEDRCVVEFVGKRARSAAEGNCGRCVPCREGTTQLTDLLRAVYDGSYDPDGIEELARVMATSSICEYGVQAGRPARTAIAEFGSEFEAHADGHCPAGRCGETLEVS